MRPRVLCRARIAGGDSEPAMSQMSFADTANQSMTAEEMKERAAMWTCRNFSAWNRMKDVARERSRAGSRFSISELSEEARYRMRIKGEDAGFKVNNSLRAALARLLIREVPECEPYIETRASKVDWV